MRRRLLMFLAITMSILNITVGASAAYVLKNNRFFPIVKSTRKR